MSRGLEDVKDPKTNSPRPEEATQRVRRRSGSRVSSAGSVNSGPEEPKLPASGDQVFGFRLRQELGRGAFARVFLADQADLAGRPVVLKVSGIDGDEPQTLAQLQHTHIVPIYSVHEDASVGLRAVCMPYFGGASLSQVLEKLWAATTRPTRGAELVEALAAVSAPAPSDARRAEGEAPPPPPRSREQTALDFLLKESYFRAAAWVVARLAEALQHAHHRGVIHRDIKPSNVLLGSGGEPMLLDFNVASSKIESGGKVVLGGTVAYMAPEHLRAMTASESAGVTESDHRSDLFSLGIVLFEALAGVRPFDLGGGYSSVTPQYLALARERTQIVPSLRGKRPDAPWGLESITRKCLEPDPARRYQHAGELAEDLRRFLDDLPLRYAPELSRRERSAKWLRRHPRLTSSGTVGIAALLLLAGGACAFAGVRQHLVETRAALAVKEARARLLAYEEGTLRALCLVNTAVDVADHRCQGVAVCEATLDVYGVLRDDDWQARAGWDLLRPEEADRLAEDTRELLLLLAWGRAAGAPDDKDAQRGALALLDRAEAIDGLAPSHALWEERAVFLDRLGDAAGAAEARAAADGTPPTSARDHYLLAVVHVRHGRYADAVEELDHALELNPRHYWSWMQRGLCRELMGASARAEADYSGSIALWPEFAWGYFNRGCVRGRMGRQREAVKDYGAALKRDPEFVIAHLNRALARLELKQYDDARADLERAAQLGRDDAALHAGLGVAYEGLKDTAKAEAAFRTAFARAESASEDVRLRTRWAYGFAVAGRLPDEAAAAFDEVLRLRPTEAHALYGRGMLLAGKGHTPEAIDHFTKALAEAPAMAEPRRYRAILLARAGKFPDALADLNWFFDHSCEDGAVHYAAACVTALWLDRLGGAGAAKQAADQALGHLEKAFALGYGRDLARDDEDLKSVRGHARFERLLGDTAARARP